MGMAVTFKSNVPAVQRKIESTANARMHKAVNEVRNKVLEKLTGSRTGEIYFVPDTRKRYTASAPGEPPAQASGTLRQSIKGKVEGKGKEIIGMVGTDRKQGPMLEFGTIYMDPRPWLRKAFEESEAKVKEIFTRIWF